MIGMPLEDFYLATGAAYWEARLVGPEVRD